MSKVAFVNGLLIDGTGCEPIEKSLVLVDGRKSFMQVKVKKYQLIMRYAISAAKQLCQVLLTAICISQGI